jgi:hypothetical protein
MEVLQDRSEPFLQNINLGIPPSQQHNKHNLNILDILTIAAI